MARRAWLMPVLGYPAFFLVCFIGSLYLTFPMGLLKGRILEELTRAVNQGRSPGQYGKPGRVTAESVDLWRLSGVSFKDLTIYPVTTNPDPPIPYHVDSLNVRVQLFPLLRKLAEISFQVRAYEGDVDGEIILTGEGFREVKSIKATADGLAWGELEVVKEKLKVPTAGTLGGDVELLLGKDAKDWTGTIKLRGQGLSVGPGELQVPAFGTLTLPLVDMGKLDGDIKINEGKSGGPPITLAGRDIQGQLDAPLALKSAFENSQFTNGALVFKLAEEFLKTNPKFQTVVDFAPPLKNARDEEGVFHYRLKGSIKSPDVKPDKSAKISGGK